MSKSRLDKMLTHSCGDKVSKNLQSDLIRHYRGKVIAFNVSDNLSPYLAAIREQGPTWLTEYPRITTHLTGALFTTIRLLDGGIKPIYVFGGNPSPLKQQLLLENYEKLRQKEQKKYPDLPKDDEFWEKYYRRLSAVGKRNAAECKKLFRMMGMPYVESPEEAGAQCAELVRAGTAYATVSSETNALTFGSKIVLRNIDFFYTGDSVVEKYHLEDVLQMLKVDYSQFVDLSILLDSGYCRGIAGLDWTELVALFRNHGTIEGVLQNPGENNLIVPEDWKYQEARELFTMSKVVDGTNIDPQWSEPDCDSILEYLLRDHLLRPNVITRAVNKLKGRFKSVHHWFEQG